MPTGAVARSHTGAAGVLGDRFVRFWDAVYGVLPCLGQDGCMESTTEVCLEPQPGQENQVVAEDSQADARGEVVKSAVQAATEAKRAL